jgi:TRAP-type C4-dicarboxylate transport system substrate-binding protein|tara:strand:- start:12 stop:1010 length:999 start_codon:yes stop_codon:yes gene_type:complete
MFKPFKIKLMAALLAISFSGMAFAKPEHTLTFSTYWPTSYNYLIDPIFSFAKKVEERSDGRVKIEIFHSKQLFGGKEEFGALERGDIDMSAPMDTYNTGAVPELGVASMPFLWPSPRAMQASLDAGLWDLGINQAMEDRGVKVLNTAAGGPYQLYGKGFSIRKPSDLKGKKVAVSGSAASRAMELIGAAPTSMSSGDLYIALQRGTIDATSRPFLTGIGRKLYEVLDNITVVNMSYFSTALAINLKTWNKLPKDIQEIFQQAANERGQEQLVLLEAYMDDAKSLFEKNNVNYHLASNAELAVFQEAVAPVYDWWKGEVGDGERYIEFAKKNQ